jgi:hypothetical protein
MSRFHKGMEHAKSNAYELSDPVCQCLSYTDVSEDRSYQSQTQKVENSTICCHHLTNTWGQCQGSLRLCVEPALKRVRLDKPFEVVCQEDRT